MGEKYKDLLVWRKAHEMVIEIYGITQRYPKAELFGLVQQLRRSASSVPANLAEGSGRQYDKEFIHFISIAKGSLFETEYYLLLSKDLGYINDECYNRLNDISKEIGKMLNGLIGKMKTSRQSSAISRQLPKNDLMF